MKITDVAPPLGVVVAEGATTTYVRTEEKDLVVVDARAREPADTFLDWFEQTYPTFHHGAVCAVPRGRDGPFVRELLQRPRTDVTHLQAMTVLLWEVTSDGVPESNRWWIAERVTVRDIPVLRHKANFLDREVRRAQRAAASHDDVWMKVLARIETKVNRHNFHSWFAETVLVADLGDVIEVGKPGPKSDLVAAFISKNYGRIVDEVMEAERPGARVHFVAVDASRRKFG